MAQHLIQFWLLIHILWAILGCVLVVAFQNQNWINGLEKENVNIKLDNPLDPEWFGIRPLLNSHIDPKNGYRLQPFRANLGSTNLDENLIPWKRDDKKFPLESQPTKDGLGKASSLSWKHLKSSSRNTIFVGDLYSHPPSRIQPISSILLKKMLKKKAADDRSVSVTERKPWYSSPDVKTILLRIPSSTEHKFHPIESHSRSWNTSKSDRWSMTSLARDRSVRSAAAEILVSDINQHSMTIRPSDNTYPIVALNQTSQSRVTSTPNQTFPLVSSSKSHSTIPDVVNHSEISNSTIEIEKNSTNDQNISSTLNPLSITLNQSDALVVEMSTNQSTDQGPQATPLASGTAERYDEDYYSDYSDETTTAYPNEEEPPDSHVAIDISHVTSKSHTSIAYTEQSMTSTEHMSAITGSNSTRSPVRTLSPEDDVPWAVVSTKVIGTIIPSDIYSLNEAQAQLTTGAIVAIVVCIFFVVLSAAGFTGYWWYKRRYVNSPETLSDRYAPSETGATGEDIFRVGYIHNPELPRQDSSEEMYSLDNDSFLTSLEAMTISNYWTENIKHTKL